MISPDPKGLVVFIGRPTRGDGKVILAQENPNRLSEWLLAAREHIPTLRQNIREWLQAVREEPALIWQTPAVRYATYFLGGLMLVWVASTFAGMLAPAPPANARPQATTADYHVVCRGPQCGRHFIVHREFGFRGFPVTCPECGQSSGVPARRCNSTECKGRWVAPLEREGQMRCPHCGKILK